LPVTTFIVFMSQAVLISLSGVMAPGPVTAATLAAGTRNRHAGGLIALGHGIVEFPLMFLVMGGMGKLFEYPAMRIGIGLLGGLFLLIMGLQTFRAARQPGDPTAKYRQTNPLWIGVLLTGGNPYFLIWWATIGMALTGRALEFGAAAFAMFAVVHWLCDLVWLETLSLAAFKGSELMGKGAPRVVLGFCSIALIVIGATFIWDAGGSLIGLYASSPAPAEALQK
jgi:threonine/homoserine/homoserine lactone efflux protein